jgi:hypothetical protein
MYDYPLGGKDNHAADRAATDAQLAIYPDVAFAARANRAFLGRAVRYLAAEAGIRQFLDIGTGIPTAGNTHQVAVSHMGTGLLDSTTRRGLEDHSGRVMQQRLTAARFFAGMDLVPPGVVRVEDWRPEPGADAGQSVLWGAVGRKR